MVPAAQNDPDALPYLLSLNNEVGSSMDYRGVQSLESNILESDVIARVSYLSKRSSSVLRPGQSYYAWTAMLEFRFTVHEYLKGTGPAEIGGIVYMAFETETQARAAAASARRRARQQMGQQGSHRVPVFAQQRGRT